MMNSLVPSRTHTAARVLRNPNEGNESTPAVSHEHLVQFVVGEVEEDFSSRELSQSDLSPRETAIPSVEQQPKALLFVTTVLDSQNSENWPEFRELHCAKRELSV